MGYAITQPWPASLAVFEAVGLGLAFPYVAIAFSPRARRLLPKPGAWMERLKQAMAFPVYGTAVWLMFVLSVEAGATVATAALTGLVLIAFAAWLYEVVRWGEGRWRNVGIAVSTLSVAGALVLGVAGGGGTPSSSVDALDDNAMGWQPYSPAGLDALRAEGRPIFVDVTAAWCITCKVNERAVLADPAVRKAFSEAGIVAIKADWTRQDADITRMLEANGRAGVPLYLLYPRARASGERPSAIVLPQILTAASLIQEVRRD
jgi:thiol:disulfide interchange protein DsbD